MPATEAISSDAAEQYKQHDTPGDHQVAAVPHPIEVLIGAPIDFAARGSADQSARALCRRFDAIFSTGSC